MIPSRNQNDLTFQKLVYNKIKEDNMSKTIKNDIETLLNIMDMGNQHNNYADERNWLLRVLYAIPAENRTSKVIPFADKWMKILKDNWASESEYFTIRNDVRTDAVKLVNDLAADELKKLHNHKQSLINELENVNKRLDRFKKWY